MQIKWWIYYFVPPSSHLFCDFFYHYFYSKQLSFTFSAKCQPARQQWQVITSGFWINPRFYLLFLCDSQQIDKYPQTWIASASPSSASPNKFPLIINLSEANETGHSLQNWLLTLSSGPAGSVPSTQLFIFFITYHPPQVRWVGGGLVLLALLGQDQNLISVISFDGDQIICS